jgi:ABC-type proline/glycine betaine transport system permease subunit
MEEDDLEKRIADLEGRPAEPVGGGGIRQKTKAGWVVVALAVLTALVNARPFFERVFPGLKNPAPEWMGLAVLAIPVVAVAIYFVVRLRRRR